MRVFILLLVILTFAFSSCKKSDADGVITGKIKTVINIIDPNIYSDTTLYYYNNDGSVNYFIRNGKRNDMSFTYASNKVTVTQYIAANNQTFIYDCFLRTGGLVDSLYHRDNTPLANKFIYDSQNQAIESRNYHYPLPLPSSQSELSAIYRNTWVNGDIVKTENLPRFPGETFSIFRTYDYFIEENNIKKGSSFGFPFNYASSTHLVKTEYENYYVSGTTEIIGTHIYTFDSSNRVLSHKVFQYTNGVPDGQTSLTLYTYY